jgi:hypothetical protein
MREPDRHEEIRSKVMVVLEAHAGAVLLHLAVFNAVMLKKATASVFISHTALGELELVQ